MDERERERKAEEKTMHVCILLKFSLEIFILSSMNSAFSKYNSPV
jgi:hypothetical protein